MASGGKREGAGRPAGTTKGRQTKEERKYTTLSIGITKEENEEIRRLAAESGKSIARFIVESILK